MSGDGSVSSVFPRDTVLVQQVQDLNRVVQEKDLVVEDLRQQNVEIREQFAATQATLSQLQAFLSTQYPGQFHLPPSLPPPPQSQP